MEAYMDACDLWEVVEEDYEIPPLPGNPTLAHIKNHKEKKTMKSKAKASIYATVSPTIFFRIITLGSAKAIWDFLKEEYQGDERIRGMKVLNLVREFEIQRMKDFETIKEYSDRLISLANKNANEDIDDQPVRGTRLLSEIYRRCNVAILEPAGFGEAISNPKWQATLEEELAMIQKNKTWQLMDNP
ncbi:hypothetical protein GH714_030756 [Hevea brasiliensis]|uniref:DUF4219 domain-containing protein n=1 Tax=Hevea brasiliensis TaxID=3981 RepID=A0A6A6LND3_HEVBR|nr:hypothetical protein GH714_030756 [Hevea brasiliensis]